MPCWSMWVPINLLFLDNVMASCLSQLIFSGCVDFSLSSAMKWHGHKAFFHCVSLGNIFGFDS
jgi:hypothetical protein